MTDDGDELVPSYRDAHVYIRKDRHHSSSSSSSSSGSSSSSSSSSSSVLIAFSVSVNGHGALDRTYTEHLIDAGYRLPECTLTRACGSAAKGQHQLEKYFG